MSILRDIGFVCLFILSLLSPVSAYQQIEFSRELCAPSKPDEPSQLNASRSIAAAGERFYLADTDAHRIVVLDQNGKLIQTWGAKGSKAGQFRRPSGISSDEMGRVYVSDTGNHRIQVFDRDGKHLRSFGEKGSLPREFNAPAGIAVANGVLAVADTKNSRVQMLTSDGIFLSQITLKARKNSTEELKAPVAVAMDVQNRVYVLDADTSMVRVFDSSGEQVRSFGARGSGLEGFENPQGFAVDRRGSIYIADTGN